MNNYKQAAWTVSVVVVQQKPRGPTTSELKNTEGVGDAKSYGQTFFSSVWLGDSFLFPQLVVYSNRGFMVARKFTVFIEPAEEGGFIIKCLELPIATQGETREEALGNIREAIEGYLEAFPEELDQLKRKRELVQITV